MIRLNILIEAHEFSPTRGSECAEGWNVVSRLAKYHNVTVLYAKGSQFNVNIYEKELNEYLSQNGKISNIEYISIEQPKATRFVVAVNKYLSKDISSIGIPILYYLGYRFWQKSAFKKAKELCKIRNFHIIHHLTSISFREPGFLWKLPVPFIWGPTGGMSSIPITFFKFLGLKYATLELIRSILNNIQFYTNIRIYNAAKKSSLIYTFSKEDQYLFRKRTGKNPRLLLDAASIEGIKTKKETTNSKYIKVLWCGQLIKRKALEFILFALSSDDQLKTTIKLKIVGTGPLKSYYDTLVARLNISENIEWIGQVDRQKVFKIMNESDLFVHSSYREATSNVIPEALSAGLPVICHDVNGMSIAINDNCGIKIPLISPKKSIEGFKNALLKLINQPCELVRLKSGALVRAKELSWDSMAKTIADDYIDIYEKINSSKIETNQ